MSKLLIVLMGILMLVVTGCATKPATAKASSQPVASGTPLDIGDSSALADIAATDDDALEALPDVVAAE